MIKKGYLEKSYNKNKGKGVKPICFFFLIMAPNLFIYSILISSLLIFFK
jgi:hypothetical protein